MMKITTWPRVLLACFALIATFAGCDRPTGPDDHPVGVFFFDLSDKQVAQVVAPRAAAGALNVKLGQTTEFRVRAFTGQGEVLDIDGREFEIVDPRVLIASSADVELVGSDRLKVTAKSLNNTSIQFDVKHAGHHEFLLVVPLIISPAN